MTSAVESNVFADIDDAPQIGSELTQVSESELKVSPRFDLTDAELGLADEMGVDLEGDLKTLIRSATLKTNQALNLVIESGLQLLAAKRFSERSENQKNNAKPEFMAALEASGMPSQRAYEAMSMAKYAANLPADAREEMLALPKTKVMLLAQADPEVVADLFADEDTDIQAISVRELKQRIREEKSAKAQATAELKKAELENEKLHKQLAEVNKGRADISDVVPPHVSDIRLETAALYHKAELSIDGIARLIPETHLLDGEWALSTARSTFAALQSLIALAKGATVELHKAYGADLDGDHSTLERLTQAEMFKCAVEYRELTGIHGKEAEKRQYLRDQDRPRGRGRPKAAPNLD